MPDGVQRDVWPFAVMVVCGRGRRSNCPAIESFYRAIAKAVIELTSSGLFGRTSAGRVRLLPGNRGDFLPFPASRHGGMSGASRQTEQLQGYCRTNCEQLPSNCEPLRSNCRLLLGGQPEAGRCLWLLLGFCAGSVRVFSGFGRVPVLT